MVDKCLQSKRSVPWALVFTEGREKGRKERGREVGSKGVREQHGVKSGFPPLPSMQEALGSLPSIIGKKEQGGGGKGEKVCVSHAFSPSQWGGNMKWANKTWLGTRKAV